MRNSVVLVVFFAAAVCSAQAPAPVPAAAKPTTTYHSDAMNFDFIYPSSFTAPKGEADQKAGAGCVSVPVAVMDMRTGFNMIFVKRFDGGCLGKEATASGLGATVVAFLTDTLSQFGKPTVNSDTGYEIASHSASVVTGSVKVLHARGDTIIYGAASCAISGKDVACFEFLSNDCPNVAVLAASGVKFTGGDVTPVIPAPLVDVCKR